MKYHNHIIKKQSEDLGDLDDRCNFMYNIYTLDGEFIGQEPTLGSAKHVVDYGEPEAI